MTKCGILCENDYVYTDTHQKSTIFDTRLNNSHTSLLQYNNMSIYRFHII